MKKKTFWAIWILVLVLLASAAFALNVQYIRPSTGRVLKQKQLIALTNSSLPNIPLTLRFTHSNVLKITVPSLNLSRFNPINASFRDVPLANVTNASHDLGLPGSGETYKVIDAYAFDILNSTGMNKTFTIEFNYLTLTNNITDPADLKVFRAGFNFTTNKTDFTRLSDTNAVIDLSAKKVTLTSTNFSVFILAEDTTPAPSPPSGDGGGSTGAARRMPTGAVFIVNCTNGIKDLGEKGIDCGPICGNVCPIEGVEEAPEEVVEEVPAEEEEAPAIIPPELIAPVREVKKPVDIWTLILGAVFIVVLIGGIALYRHQHLAEARPYPAKRIPLKPLPAELEPEEKAEPSLLTKKFDIVKELGRVKEGPKPEKPKPLMGTNAMQRLVEYIHREEDKNFNREMITKALLLKKWPKDIINEAFSMVDSMKQSIHSSTINKLHKYIMKEFAKGFDEMRIKEALLNKEWPEFMINEAFNQLQQLEHDLKEARLHIVSKDLDSAKEGVKSLLSKGYNKKKLLNALLLAGWPSDAAKKLVK